jgi:hypothetical protein
LTSSPQLGYVQARIQARYGERPDASDWSSLVQIRGLGHFVQQAAGVGLGPWLEKLGPNSTAHAVETSLREAFRHTVTEVASWMPRPWRRSIRWFALLIDLEPIRLVASGDRVPAWFLEDPFLGALARDAGCWPLPLLGALDGDGNKLVERWHTRWAQYTPALTASETRLIARIRSQLPISAYDGAVTARLERSFRAFAGTPLAVFSFLGLVLCDLLRLRGELLLRIGFTGRSR